MALKAQKRPVLLDFIQFTGADTDNDMEAVERWATDAHVIAGVQDAGQESIQIFNAAQNQFLRVRKGDYILRGEKQGDYYPVDPETFENGFDIVEVADPEPVKDFDDDPPSKSVAKRKAATKKKK